MNINLDRQGGKLIVAITGRLDTITAPDFESAVNPVLNDVNELVVDLKELDYISSSGLRALVGAAKMMDGKGTMKVINPNDVVMDIFMVTGLDGILNIT